MISIHTLCEEGDKLQTSATMNLLKFQSTPSVKRVTIHHNLTSVDAPISIHTLCEEGDMIKK